MSQGPMRYSPINQTRSAMRKKRLNNQKNVLVLIVTALIIFTLFFTVLLISLSVASAKRRNDLNNPDSSESGNASISENGSESIPGSESGSDSPIGDFTYKLKDFSESAMHLGPLVIINDENEYTFADEKSVLGIRERRVKNSAGVALYALGTWEMYLRNDAINALNALVKDFYGDCDDQYITVIAAYRNYKDQEASYNRYPDASPKPGFSDYHSGYSFDIIARVIKDDSEFNNKASSLFTSFSEKKLTECYKYGLINRYPSGKADITGDYEDHLRYVGIPHAYIMNEMGYCLEEYIDYVRMHMVDDKHIKYDIDGVGSYDIYYVPATSGGITKVPVPEGDYEYTVSGDNCGGFIVTVKTK